MQITFFSLMMALIWASVAIIGMFFLRRNIYTVSYFNVKILFLMYLLCVIRICFPVEFSFTKVIKTPILYNWLFPFFMKDLNFLAITPCEILIIIWGTVSFFMFLHLFYGYYRIHKEIQTLYHYESADTTQNIRTQFPEFASLEYVIVNHAFPSPMQIGFIHPIILLPTIQYDSKDFYYILSMK